MRLKGYTFVEVLVSLTIVGLLFSFGFANFRDYSRRQALAGVARNLKGELRLAQSKASAGEKPAACSASILSTYSFQIINSTSYKITADCSGGINVDIKTVSFPEGVTMSPASGTVSFKVLGQGTNIIAGGSVVITLTQVGTNNTSLVTVASGGEIK